MWAAVGKFGVGSDSEVEVLDVGRMVWLWTITGCEDDWACKEADSGR